MKRRGKTNVVREIEAFNRTVRKEIRKSLSVLAPDDLRSIVTTCFAMGAGYYRNEAANLDKGGNLEGAKFNVLKAEICDELYRLARLTAGKPVHATDAEIRAS